MNARSWRWLLDHAVLAMHRQQLAEHGGLDGIRDPGMLDSALAKPKHLASYGGDEVDLAALAAAYAAGIAKNHPFLDGNKRTAAVACETFVMINGGWITATEAEFCTVVLALADGSLDEDALAAWLRENLERRDTQA